MLEEVGLNSWDIILALGGIAFIISKDFKEEGDKFQDTEEDFNVKRYFKKNYWDFIFYLIGGLGGLFCKSLIFSVMGLSDTITNNLLSYGGSMLSGALGSFVLGAFVDQGRKIKIK